MDGWLDGWLDGWVGGWSYGWMMNGWTDRWMNGQMNGWMGTVLEQCVSMIYMYIIYCIYNYIRMMMSLQHSRKETFFLYFVLIWKLN